MNSLALAVLGGDKRQPAMMEVLAKRGLMINAWGFSREECRNVGACHFEDWREAVKASDTIILPLPYSTDGVRVNAPLCTHSEGLRLHSLLQAVHGKLLFGGKLSDHFVKKATEQGVRCIDYFESEVLQLLNALPSVEGAIEIAMRELPVTIDGCSICVIGYGRIGELLAQRLRALGAFVTVYARREEVLIRAALSGHNTVLMSANGVTAFQGTPQVVFNTVPKQVLDRAALSGLEKSCVLIELASAPGGINLAAAQALGLRTVIAPGLPGKYAPVSAGKYLAQALTSILKREDLL